MMIYHRHLRSLGYCNRGARAFFRRHGWDWGLFLREGISSEVVAKCGDSMAAAAIRRAEKENRYGR